MVECLCALFGLFVSFLQAISRLIFGNPTAAYIAGFIIAFIAATNVQCARIICEYGWGKRKNRNDNDGVEPISESCYGYDFHNGPHTWNSPILNQSPINISDENIVNFPIRERLTWNHYNDLPLKMTIFNSGHTVILRAKYKGNRPTVCGADLMSSYTFVDLRFRWAQTNHDGSEHMIKTRKYPLEMQVMHRAGPYGQDETSSLDILIIAYFFEVAVTNHYLDPIIHNLHLIKKAGTKIEIPPFPLSYLCHPFRAGFYSYGGSLTEPPCFRGAEWFVYPETITLSQAQMCEFRQLLNEKGGRIIRNSRPVQIMDETRCVNMNFYNPNLASESCGEPVLPQCENDEDNNLNQPNILNYL